MYDGNGFLSLQASWLKSDLCVRTFVPSDPGARCSAVGSLGVAQGAGLRTTFHFQCLPTFIVRIVVVFFTGFPEAGAVVF